MSKRDMDLWHYTSIETLHGIFSNIKKYQEEYIILRAGYFMNMNDPFDCSYLINEIGEIDGNQKDASIILSEFETSGIPYFISFSEAEDNLPMWKMYGNGGHGCALVFSEERLKGCLDNYQSIGDEKHICEMKKNFMKYVKCHYWNHDEIANWYNNEFNNKQQIDDKDLYTIAYCIKNSDYEYEQEWRVVLLREQCEILGPEYIEVWVPVSAIQYICAGPCVPETLIKNMVNNATVGIRKSKVSYTDIPKKTQPLKMKKNNSNGL